MTYIGKVMRRIRAWVFRNVSRGEIKPGLVRPHLVAEPWFVDLLMVDPNARSIDVQGWSFARPNGDRTEFFANQHPFAEVAYPLLRVDVGKLFWQRSNADNCGFRCVGSFDSPIYPNGVLELSRTSDADPLSKGRDSWYFPDPALHTDVPDEDRRYRVIGNRDLTGFLNTGATDFYRLDAATRSLSGKHIWEFESVLDWGVGCGRLARHWPKEYAANLTGCDIDHENVAWCSVNLSGRFVESNLRPPLPFSDASFDLIYGVSVFTHLKEALQFEWLRELQRVSKKGGLVLTTVHGATAIDFFRLAPVDYARLNERVREEGILFGSTNPQLDGHVDHEGQYVNVFHSREYILTKWSEYFEVVAVIPGYIFTHDLVILRKR